ncbi:hypothetical protein GCM10027160_26740 [Streptomyces calidiresistens]
MARPVPEGAAGGPAPGEPLEGARRTAGLTGARALGPGRGAGGGTGALRAIGAPNATGGTVPARGAGDGPGPRGRDGLGGVDAAAVCR